MSIAFVGFYITHLLLYTALQEDRAKCNGRESKPTFPVGVHVYKNKKISARVKKKHDLDTRFVRVCSPSGIEPRSTARLHEHGTAECE